MFAHLKSAFITGIVVILPVVLLFLLIKETIDFMIEVATPIADLFPEGTFDSVRETEILAALLIIGAALIVGFLAKIPASRSVGAYIENKTIGRLPFYRMLRTLITAFLNMEDGKSFKPALIDGDSGVAEPAYVIEDQGGPQIVVLVPWSPATFSGSVKLVPRERVRVLPVTLDEFSMSLSHFGLGLSEILPNEPESSDPC